MDTIMAILANTDSNTVNVLLQCIYVDLEIGMLKHKNYFLIIVLFWLTFF